MAQNLNPQQQAALKYIDGPLLVLAGAGSGKTSVITRKDCLPSRRVWHPRAQYRRGDLYQQSRPRNESPSLQPTGQERRQRPYRLHLPQPRSDHYSHRDQSPGLSPRLFHSRPRRLPQAAQRITRAPHRTRRKANRQRTEHHLQLEELTARTRPEQ